MFFRAEAVVWLVSRNSMEPNADPSFSTEERDRLQ
ncbi:hypothetical protein FOCG_11643 [Fusarium oxysporum f. sp. radicis-lycopersici 26381]|nr:hypothetical protein FOCG_11643 [Fusarium oxysporum f. sp. radicis-lycopersici 26381]